jgi:hypothetical protein
LECQGKGNAGHPNAVEGARKQQVPRCEGEKKSPTHRWVMLSEAKHLLFFGACRVMEGARESRSFRFAPLSVRMTPFWFFVCLGGLQWRDTTLTSFRVPAPPVANCKLQTSVWVFDL